MWFCVLTPPCTEAPTFFQNWHMGGSTAQNDAMYYIYIYMMRIYIYISYIYDIYIYVCIYIYVYICIYVYIYIHTVYNPYYRGLQPFLGTPDFAVEFPTAIFPQILISLRSWW